MVVVAEGNGSEVAYSFGDMSSKRAATSPVSVPA